MLANLRLSAKICGSLLLRLLRRPWWWTKVAVCYETRARRIILLRNAAGPEILGTFFRRLYCHLIVFPARRNRDFALQVSAIELHVRRTQTIEHCLRWMPVTVPRTTRNNR